MKTATSEMSVEELKRYVVANEAAMGHYGKNSSRNAILIRQCKSRIEEAKDLLQSYEMLAELDRRELEEGGWS